MDFNILTTGLLDAIFNWYYKEKLDFDQATFWITINHQVKFIFFHISYMAIDVKNISRF